MKIKVREAFFVSILLATIIGCNGKSDRAQLIGLWQVLEINFLAKEIGDGLEWFHFYEDGVVESRTGPSNYQKGWWSINPEKHTLYIREQAIDSMAYDYKFHDDTLEMVALIGTLDHVRIRMTRTEKVLIEYETEMTSPKPADWR